MKPRRRRLSLVGQTRVNGVDSFNEEHRVRFELQGLAVVLADSSHEVVFWHLHRLAGLEQRPLSASAPRSGASRKERSSPS